MAEPLLRVSGLKFTYENGTEALRGIDFQLFPGETVALLGPNGSGKTTFILHLNGLHLANPPVEVCGSPVTKENLNKVRKVVGIVFQDADGQLFMPTVLEDVMFGPLNSGRSFEESEELARKSLTATGVLHCSGKAPYHLSAGEKRRVAIAGVIAMSPKILVLDEPTTYLDPPGQRDLHRVLKSLPQSKIIVTHDVHFAEAAATRAVFFQEGSIVAQGSVAELVRRYDWSPVRHEL